MLTYTLFNTTVAFALFPFFSSLAPLMAVAFLLGLGLGAAQPNVMSLLHSRSPEGRVGEALGLRTTIMNSSHVVLPLVFGAFGSVLGAGRCSGRWRRWSAVAAPPRCDGGNTDDSTLLRCDALQLNLVKYRAPDVVPQIGARVLH